MIKNQISLKDTVLREAWEK